MSRVLLTGATGFVGQALRADLLSRGVPVLSAVRSDKSAWQDAGNHRTIVMGEIGAMTDWQPVLHAHGSNGESVPECVIHCAARTHVMRETEADALAAYRAVNVAGSRRLAEQAAAAGVRRLIFLSSIKASGERTSGTVGFTGAEANPEDPYGISKWEAEQALREIAARTKLEIVLVRPPLIYGPGAKGNLARLLGLLRRGLPLPLSAIDNRRSMIGLDNLVDLLIRCIDHPQAPGQTFAVSDAEDLSTPDLLRRMAKAMGRSACLFPLPSSVLQLAGRAIGKQAEVERLLGSLRVDSSHVRRIMGWVPPVSVDEGIRKMVNWYMAHQ